MGKNILEVCEYIVKKKGQLFVAPVWVPGYNDEEMPKLIEFGKKLKGKMCIQNFLNYRFGRNPCKAKDFKQFFIEMRELEKKHNVKLIVDASDFSVVQTKKLEKPFKKNDIIEAKILFEGRLKGEKVAFAKNRLISVLDCNKEGRVKLKIVKSKHNLFMAT